MLLDACVITYSFVSEEWEGSIANFFFFPLDYTACFHNVDHLEIIPGTSSV